MTRGKYVSARFGNYFLKINPQSRETFLARIGCLVKMKSVRGKSLKWDRRSPSVEKSAKVVQKNKNTARKLIDMEMRRANITTFTSFPSSPWMFATVNSVGSASTEISEAANKCITTSDVDVSSCGQAGQIIDLMSEDNLWSENEMSWSMWLEVCRRFICVLISQAELSLKAISVSKGETDGGTRVEKHAERTES
jgi:hypothetical protein